MSLFDNQVNGPVVEPVSVEMLQYGVRFNADERRLANIDQTELSNSACSYDEMAVGLRTAQTSAEHYKEI